MRYLIGVDDTDNLQSRGTGYRTRCMGSEVQRFAHLECIVRHQLLVDPQIPYTSHNSSVCMVVDMDEARFEELVDFCRSYLCSESAPGSDAGLCIAPLDQVADEIQEFGLAARSRVIQRQEAVTLGQKAQVLLEGLTGDHNGIIGALAAVGLQAVGNDGRYIWSPGIRELNGVYTAASLYQSTGIQAIVDPDKKPVPDNARINVAPWPRPVLLTGKAVLLVEPAPAAESYEWQLLPKEIIKQY